MKYPTIKPGDQFGRLIVTEQVEQRPNGHIFWLCSFSCGSTSIVYDYALKIGHTQSCGCWQKERASQTKMQHGMSRRKKGEHDTPEYRAWCKMKQRCLNPNNSEYARYGGRGITICQEFLDSFETWYAEIGPRPDPEYSLGRINNERGYEKGNIRWETKEQQDNNRRSNHLLTYEGKTQTIVQWAKESDIQERGISVWALYSRRNQLGYTDEEALTIPAHRRRER